MRRRLLLANSHGGSLPIDTNNYLTIVALEDGLTASLSTNACEYCIDGDGNWETLPAGTSSESINAGQTLSFRAKNLTPSPNVGIGSFSITASCKLYGNVMSMLFGDDAANNISLSGYSYAFYRLFKGCETIKAVTDSFLPATTLASNCYSNMFEYCTSLTTAPELPATTLASNCYRSMFEYCFKLSYIKAMFTTTPSSSYTNKWVSNVAPSEGTFVKNKNATWNVVGVNGIPSGWTVKTE